MWKRINAWAGALSWCNIQIWFSHNSGLFLRTASHKRAKTSWYNCLFTIWPHGTNSWWTVPFQSKNTTNNTLSFDWLIHAFFGQGDHFFICLVKQLKCLCKTVTKFAANTHKHTCYSSSSFTVTLSLIRQTACARAPFSKCSSTTNDHSEMGQMAVSCQNLTLGALSSRSMLSVLVGMLLKTFGLFLNMPCIHQPMSALNKII
jgi:hypothetical protein